MSDFGDPVVANVFHAGSTCPYCQAPVEAGQNVVRCVDCGSLHHDTCARMAEGCASYHCASGSRAPVAGPAEVIITPEEAARAEPPPRPPRPSGADAGKPFLPSKPTRRSRLAIAAAVVVCVALLGAVGAVADVDALLIVGGLAAVAAIILAVVALVMIHSRRGLFGSGLAGGAVLVGSLVLIACFVRLDVRQSRFRQGILFDVNLLDSMPEESELARLAPERANALRANVVLSLPPSGLLGGQAAFGSGIVLQVEDRTATILTNRHVLVGQESRGIGDAARIDVLFYNGERSEARIAWLAPEDVDLAVITCQALTLDQLEPIRLREDLLPQGEPVFAVGNPQGLYWSYTEGVISGFRRQEYGGRVLGMYQTQTPINAGNSGGGLYDTGGRLVGVNTWTFNKAAAEGLNFAISTPAILDILGQEKRARFLGPAEGSEPPLPAASSPSGDGKGQTVEPPELGRDP